MPVLLGLRISERKCFVGRPLMRWPEIVDHYKDDTAGVGSEERGEIQWMSHSFSFWYYPETGKVLGALSD